MSTLKPLHKGDRVALAGQEHFRGVVVLISDNWVTVRWDDMTKTTRQPIESLVRL
jgi:hypothetical protein